MDEVLDAPALGKTFRLTPPALKTGPAQYWLMTLVIFSWHRSNDGGGAPFLGSLLIGFAVSDFVVVVRVEAEP